MKVISEEEQRAHYNTVLKGGAVGGTLGLALGTAGVLAASRRWTAFRHLTLPFRAFLVTSTGTAGAIITAERYSINFQRAKDPQFRYKDVAQRAEESHRASESAAARMKEWGRENRYTIVLSSWVAAIGIAFALVSRNRYLTTSQKIVQARVYAQGLTLLVLVATAALEMGDAKEGKGRWETIMVLDPNDPTHKHLIEKRIHKEEYPGQDLWRDMVDAEERRMEEKRKQKVETAKQQ